MDSRPIKTRVVPSYKEAELLKESLKKEYFLKKQELDKIKDSVTLQRWKVLSEAYIIGKKIWGFRFTRVRLASDMELPYTTCLRCLSLDKVNPKTWRLINKNKISVFKVAQICMSKNITYQDEIVDIVIKDDLSTYQIKSLKVNNLSDVNKERHRISIEKGYSHKWSAAANFNLWIDRGFMFLLMDKDKLPKDKLEEIELKLKDLDKNIKVYLKNRSCTILTPKLVQKNS